MCPSRSCILTGLNSWQLEQGANHWSNWPTKFQSFAEALFQNGYNVGYTAKGWAPGVAKNPDGSKRDLLVNAFNEIKTKPPTNYISTIDYSANFNQFIKDCDSTKPFFFWYGGLEPYRGYEYRSGIEKENKQLSQIDDDEVFYFWPKVDLK